jgi:hypothetical protein
LSTEITTPETGNLPALRTSEFDISDFTFPGIFLQADLSKGVKAGLTRPGDVIWAMGTDDPSPTIIARHKDNGEPLSFEGYVVGHRKWHGTQDDAGRWTYTAERDEADRSSWTGYDFLISIPEVDDTFPARWRLVKTAGLKAARDINMFLFKASKEDGLPPRIKVSIGQRPNKNGQLYYFPQVARINHGEDLQAAVEMKAFGGMLDPRKDEGVVEGAEPTPAGPGF